MDRNFFTLVPKKHPRALTTRSAQGTPDEHESVTPRKLAHCSTREARQVLKYEIAEKLGVLPLGLMIVIGEEVLTVAAPKEREAEVISALRFATGKTIKVVPTPEKVVHPAIFPAYHGDSHALKEKIDPILLKNDPVDASLRNKDTILEFRPQSGEAATFFASIVDYAISHHASDLHIIPTYRGTILRMRVDGELQSHDEAICSLEFHSQVISRIKVLSKLDTTQKNLPHDGAFEVPISNRRVHVRVSILPTIFGEKAVLRFLGSEGVIPLEKLGLEEPIYENIRHFIQKEEGVLLLAGPTGSGKTTTMYSVLEALQKRNASIVSVEDPVEISLPGISQTSISEKTGLTYETALKSVLRQDPDVILIGEIRDKVSAQIAFQAALTGHLIISTVHARNAAEVFLRLSTLGLDSLTIGQALSLVVCQRLLPRLCDSCKVFDLLASHAAPFQIVKPAGCHACDSTGYSGRALISESLYLDTPLSNLIISGDLNPNSIHKLLNGKNHVPFKSSLERLLKEGKIGVEQFMSHERSP